MRKPASMTARNIPGSRSSGATDGEVLPLSNRDSSWVQPAYERVNLTLKRRVEQLKGSR